MANFSNADIKLPPAIVGSHQYRCKDNSVVAIDWLSDGTANSARVTPKGGATVALAQVEAGGPYTAEGASLTGDPKAPSVTYKGQAVSAKTASDIEITKPPVPAGGFFMRPRLVRRHDV